MDTGGSRMAGSDRNRLRTSLMIAPRLQVLFGQIQRAVVIDSVKCGYPPIRHRGRITADSSPTHSGLPGWRTKKRHSDELATTRPIGRSARSTQRNGSLTLPSMGRTERPEQRPRHALSWALVFAAVSATALWMVVGNRWNLQDNPVASRIALAYFFVLSAAPYWMVYDSWQHDRKLTRKMWLFFVPGGFLWYYFEVYRPRLEARRRKAPKENPRTHL